MREFSEKRDFHRMQVNTEITITDSEGSQHNGICKDLSGTGMQILLDSSFAEGSRLHTVLPSTSDQFPPFETVAEVLRCEPTEGGYLIGAVIRQVKH
ncbi:PilZ domain-containing protein [Marinobacter fonticola]|uniref:PilZ domain-containing protein n=1 Tax=Marinobacter fonticola TaxID=2603215 RepID=UPI0011E63B36|nr:PilZ domain-containing protein [Marinobacter fonticola]